MNNNWPGAAKGDEEKSVGEDPPRQTGHPGMDQQHPPAQHPQQHQASPSSVPPHHTQQSPASVNNHGRYHGGSSQPPPPQSQLPPPGAHGPDGTQAPMGNGGGMPGQPPAYYPPMYPAPGAPPDPGYRGYDPGYGMPPPHMGYPHHHPMYAYQPPMYGGYPPHYGPPGHHPHHPMGGYGYAPSQPMPPGPHHMPPPDASSPRYDDGQHPPPGPPMPGAPGAGVAPPPYHTGTTADANYMKYKDKEGGGSVSLAESKDDDTPGGPKDGANDEIVPGAVTARLKTYIKPRNPISQDNRDRRARKNAQSRARACKLRDRVLIIESKPIEERTAEEKQLWLQYENRRQKKNDRSRERAMEKKEEIDRILAKPENKRSKIEKKFLETALVAKKRKNEGDRLRRQRMKELGLSAKSAVGLKPGITARGPLPVPFNHAPPHPHHHMGAMPHPHHPYPHMGEIPMSPMPTMGHPYHHHQQQPSPGTFGSPGMMVGYPSPQQRSRSAAAPGVMETPGRSRAEAPLPYIPPPQAYDTSSPAHNGHSNRVEQRRNPDGSMRISIGGGTPEGGGGPPFGDEAALSEVPNLFYGEGGEDPPEEHDGKNKE